MQAGPGWAHGEAAPAPSWRCTVEVAFSKGPASRAQAGGRTRAVSQPPSPWHQRRWGQPCLGPWPPPPEVCRPQGQAAQTSAAIRSTCSATHTQTLQTMQGNKVLTGNSIILTHDRPIHKTDPGYLGPQTAAAGEIAGRPLSPGPREEVGAARGKSSFPWPLLRWPGI